MGEIRGNVDYDIGDAIDISDLVYLVDYMFNQGPAPLCWPEANVDGNGPDDNSGVTVRLPACSRKYSMNRRGSKPYARWCGRTVGATPAPTRWVAHSLLWATGERL